MVWRISNKKKQHIHNNINISPPQNKTGRQSEPHRPWAWEGHPCFITVFVTIQCQWVATQRVFANGCPQ